MKKDIYLKYRKYEFWGLMLLIPGSLLSGFISLLIMVFINIYLGLIVAVILSTLLGKYTNKLDNKATKYLLESYEREDDPYSYVDHLLP